MSQFVNAGPPAGLANGTAITTGNASNPDGWGAVVVAAGGSITANTGVTFKGLPSYQISAPASGATYLQTPGIWASPDAAGLGDADVYFSFPALPATAQGILNIRNNSGTTGLASVLLNSDGTLKATNDAPAPNGGTSATTTGTLAANTKYRIDVSLDDNPGGAAGTLSVHFYDEATESIVASTVITMSGQTYSATANPGMVRIGRTSGTGAWTINVGVTRWKTGDNAQWAAYTATLAAPTATFTATPQGMSVALDASGSTPASGGTITSYAWDYGDGSTGGGTPKTHQYSSPGIYTITLTVTGSNGLTSTATHDYDARLPVNEGHAYSIATSAGWTNTGGAADLLTALTDGSDATYAASPVGATSANPLGVYMPPMNAPKAGETGKIKVRCLRTTASASGSYVAKLYIGASATPFSTTAAVTVASGSPPGFTTYEVIVPAADLAIPAATDWTSGGVIRVRVEPTVA